MASSSDWVAGLRQSLKQQFPLGGFTVREMKGKVFLQKRWPDGSRQAAALPINWGPGVTLEVLATVKAVNEHLQAGASLKDAVHLQWPQEDTTAAGRKKVGTNWVEVTERFRVHKIQSGQVKETTWGEAYAYVMREILEVLPGASNGKALLTAIAKGAPGSRGRVVRIERAAQFLKFAVREVGVDARWLPPQGDDLIDIKGRKAPNAQPEFANAGQAIPLKDEQFLALLEEIPDPRWRLAVGLVGVFGLRPVELNYCRPDGDGLRIEYQKRTARGCSPKRTVEALDPINAPGMGARLLLELQSGVTELPPLGAEDSVAAGRMNQYLGRRPLWVGLRDQVRASGQGRLSSYSLRHGYAFRSAMVYDLPVRAVAALMGHSVQVHVQHYGKWVDGAAVKSAVQAARARVVSG